MREEKVMFVVQKKEGRKWVETARYEANDEKEEGFIYKRFAEEMRAKTFYKSRYIKRATRANLYNGFEKYEFTNDFGFGLVTKNIFIIRD